MRKKTTEYDFLPDGWYFTYDEYDYDGYTKLFTSSGVNLAWKKNRSSINSLQIVDGMEHELEFVKFLFEKKELRDKIEFERRMSERDARTYQEQQEQLEKVKKDFESIQRPQPPSLTPSQAISNLDSKIQNFKNKYERV